MQVLAKFITTNGIPLTKSGRQRKWGSMFSNNSCSIVNFRFYFQLISIIIIKRAVFNSNIKTNLIKYSPNISITANNQRLKAIHLFSLPPEEQEFAVEVLYPRIN